MYSGEMSTLSVAFGKTLVRPSERPIAVRKDLDDPRDRLPERPDAESEEHRLGELAAALAGDEHVGAGRALGIGEHAVLLDDERAAQRHHHQDAEDAAGEGEHRDLEVVEEALAAVAEEEQRRHGEDDPRGHRLAGRADRLDDVVLEDRRAAEPLQDRDGEHGDRDRRADRQPGAQPEVDRRGAEEQPEQRAEHDGLGRELGRRLAGRDVGLKAAAG